MQAWADQHAEDIARAASQPTLILPRSVVIGSRGSPPPIAQIWRREGVRGSAGRLRTWLFVLWLAQSERGGIDGRYRDRVSLLRPFVERRPALPEMVDAIDAPGTRCRAKLEFPGMDPRRRLDAHLQRLRESGFLVERQGEWIPGLPTVDAGTGRAKVAPVVADDHPRYAFTLDTSGAIVLAARLTTSGTWSYEPGFQDADWLEVSSFSRHTTYPASDSPSHLAQDLQALADVPDRHHLRVPWPILRKFSKLTANEIVVVLAMIATDESGTLRSTSEVRSPRGDQDAVRLGVRTRTLSDAIQTLISKSSLSKPSPPGWARSSASCGSGRTDQTSNSRRLRTCRSAHGGGSCAWCCRPVYMYGTAIADSLLRSPDPMSATRAVFGLRRPIPLSISDGKPDPSSSPAHREPEPTRCSGSPKPRTPTDTEHSHRTPPQPGHHRARTTLRHPAHIAGRQPAVV